MNNLFIHAAIWIDIMPKKKKKMLLLKDYILYDFFYVTLLRKKKQTIDREMDQWLSRLQMMQERGGDVFVKKVAQGRYLLLRNIPVS